MRWALVLTLSAAACSQEVVAPPCDLHDDAAVAADSSAPAPDGSLEGDAGASPDASLDASAADAEPTDATSGCASYCLRSLSASATVADVRQTVAFVPSIDNPRGASLSFSAEYTTARRPGRPAFVASEAEVELTVDEATGRVELRIADVPPWFLATTFTVRLSARGPSPGDPVVEAEASVKIRGNLVFSAEYSDHARVYAVASDGRLPRAIDPSNTRGELLTALVRFPGAVRMSRSGSLLVFDEGPTPPRILRFELSGYDQQLSTFELADAQGAPHLVGRTYVHSMLELEDERVLMLDYEFSRTPKSRVAVFRPDGTLERFVVASDPAAVWTGLGLGPGGELLLTRLDLGGRVERYDLAQGTLLGTLADNLPSTPRSVLGLPGGVVYLGGDGYVLRIQGAQRSLVAGLPGGSSANWWALTTFEGRVLATDDERGDGAMPVFIDGRAFGGRMRQAGAGNLTAQILGIDYLE